MPQREPLYLIVSLDVEEEGLFGGSYARRAPGVSNTAQLFRLTPLLERGVRPTLFCAHSVLTDLPSCRILSRLRDDAGAEIGAHLHHWNTPPLSLEGDGSNLPDMADQVPASALPLPLMAAKLDALFRVGRDFQGAPLTSFRMGRWDLHRAHWPLLAQAGVLCDASVRPLHCAPRPLSGAPTGPDHFDAPAHPYWVPVEGQRIFEMPLTVTPLLRPLPGALGTSPFRKSVWGTALRASVKSWGALALLPVYHPLWAMQAVTRLFAARGGRVLSLTWHSSEMLPGGAPHVPHAAAVEALMGKIRDYVDWLHRHWDVRCLTLDALRLTQGNVTPCPRPAAPCDWTTGPDQHTPPQTKAEQWKHHEEAPKEILHE